MVSDMAVEKFCNEVASEFLLPEDELKSLNIKSTMDFDEIMIRISDFADSRNLSSSMVSYKLFLKELISREVWQKLSSAYREYWHMSKRRETKKSDRGPSTLSI
jgi:Zn-dependent peptidase ImmA (M78 family)